MTAAIMAMLPTSRTANAVRSLASNPTIASSSRLATFSISRRFASQDYGSGAQNNEPNPSVDKEHPGPPPPKGAQIQGKREEVTTDNTGSGTKTPKDRQQSQSKRSGAQPKILSDSPPKDGEEPEDVRKHNEDMKDRAEKAYESVRDKDLANDKAAKGSRSGQ